MKISVNWLKEYTKIDLPIDKLVEKIGAQLGAVEEIVDLGAKYKGALIVKVTSCVQHPNADKLHVCMIDDGKVTKDVPRAENGQIQVVCGANNVAEGQTVIWLPPGAVVPETYGTNEPFELTAKELRGILSQGMIASARELDFGDDHAGIIVLDQDVEPGTPITKTFWLDDYIIDIENKMFTHRPDCFGILGVAREVAGIQNTDFKSPDWYLTESSEQVNSSSNNLPLIIENNVPSIAPRFMAIVMSDIEIAKSPFWLQTFLARLGVKPINNVVDVTNFVMLLTGQPLHAYDYDKVAKTNSDGAARIIVRKANDKEELILLGNKSIELDSKVDSAIIATDKMAIGLGGLMGGADTEVDDETKNIILECANFDMFAIRKTAMKYGIFTDAFTRFSKNQSKFQNDRVITKAAEMIKENANGVLASKTMDTPNVKYVKQFVKTTAQFINKRLGLSLSVYEIAKLLKNVEFEVTVNQDSLDISAPFWRTDIEIAEDIVEEVGRLYGFGKLPVELPHRTLKPAKKDELFKLKGQIRQNLASAGANELLTYSFVHGKLIDKAGQNRDLAFQLSNALSPDLQYYRMSILPSLLDKTHANIKAGFGQFGLFEIGKVHLKDWLDEEKLPKEEQRLGFLFAADAKETTKYYGAAYYQVTEYLTNLCADIGVTVDFAPLPAKAELAVNEQLAAPFALQRSAIVLDAESGVLLGVAGEFKPNIQKVFKLPSFCAGFELDVAQLLKSSAAAKKYNPISKFPKVEQDISLKVDTKVTYKDLLAVISDGIVELKPQNTTVNISPLDIYQRPEDQAHKQIALRVTFCSFDKTLKAEEINKLLDDVAAVTAQKIGAERL